ncbi:MAG: DivIVA domain-containing protein [Actinomycetota bacterium]|nr:DivIVA domain-containing protein [Actinomycetota bacterium]
MADDTLGPDTFSTRDLPTSRRGYQKKSVDALIARAVEEWGTLARRHQALMDEIGRSGGPEHFARDLEAVAAEIGKILDAAKEASDGMRMRAREDAARVESEAEKAAAERLQASADESARILAEAERQAFELRRDAWDAGDELIRSIQETGEDIVAEAGEQALGIRADAEKEAHQRHAIARKEADDIIRNGRYESDRLLNQAKELAQKIIDRASGADDETEPSERPRRRKRELSEEVERLHAERTIEDVAVLPAEPVPRRSVSEVSFGALDPQAPELSEALAAEVQFLNDTPPPAPWPADSGWRRRPAPESGDDVGTLFDALRTTAEHDAAPASLPRDPMALRDRLVLPVSNEGLRDVKRRIVDLQTAALDAMKVGAWSPDQARITGELTAVLETPIQKAGGAGATAAGVLAGVPRARSRPGTRPTALVNEMAQDLVAQLVIAVSSEGGPSEIAATVSRVFRSWRGDEAERWVRTIAFAAYHDSLLAALSVGGWTEVRGVPSGRPCANCAGHDRTRWDPESDPPAGLVVPPANVDCLCTVTISGE